jgi:DNA-binding MarR family transcriptional regulator
VGPLKEASECTETAGRFLACPPGITCGGTERLSAIVTIQLDDCNSLGAADQPAMDEISKAIWQETEEVLDLLRRRSQNAIHRQKKPGILWLDELTETQGNTVIAVRQLCDESPEGVTLKKLAETMGVTPAAASVMVDLLVKKKMLKRTKSKSDRRAVLIRLTPDTAGLFDISEGTLLQTFAGLQETLGKETLLDWHRILLKARVALRQLPGIQPSEDSDEHETSSADVVGE